MTAIREKLEELRPIVSVVEFMVRLDTEFKIRKAQRRAEALAEFIEVAEVGDGDGQ